MGRRFWTQRHPFAVAAIAFAGSYAVALLVHYVWLEDKNPTVASSFNVFALLFVLALAIERIIQPFARFLGPDSKAASEELERHKATLETVKATATATATAAAAGTASPTAAASEEAARSVEAEVGKAAVAVKEAREETSVAAWGCASGLGFLFAAFASVGILHIVLATDPPWVPFDILVTGTVIGAGTKPLNDLWTRLQNK